MSLYSVENITQSPRGPIGDFEPSGEEGNGIDSWRLFFKSAASFSKVEIINGCLNIFYLTTTTIYISTISDIEAR